jgi:TetR/AcrR family transcriptional regulator, transcriptional repressor for nem operon
MTSKGELTKERILAEATKLVQRKGFDATSINDLMAVTGLKKGCLYFHFSGKDELSLAVLEKARTEFFKDLDAKLGVKPAGERLDHFLKGLLELNKEKHFEGGCIFGNTALEMSGKNQRMTKFVADVFNEWIERMTKIVKDAQDAGSVRKDIPAVVAARQIIMSMEGAIMLTRLEMSGKPMKDCVSSLRILLGMK